MGMLRHKSTETIDTEFETKTFTLQNTSRMLIPLKPLEPQEEIIHVSYTEQHCLVTSPNE